MTFDNSDLIDVDSLFENNPDGTCSYTDQQREINRYCAKGRADRSTNVSEWWKSYQTTFPNLEKMSRDYLSISATSVPSERLFSRGSSIILCHI